jgi:hypothetical protein
MIARGKGDDTALSLFRRKLEQAVRGASKLERAACLEAFAL